MRRDTDGAHPRSAAAMWDREGLVQIQVTNVGADRRRAREPHLCVHVGAVHVHLSAVLVDDVADGADLVLENTMRRGVRDHQAGQAVAMLSGLGPQVRHIDIAVRRRCDDDHAHPCHGGRGGIGAMCRGWYQHHIAVLLAACVMMRTNHHETGVFPLRARVGLERHRRETGDLAERGFHVAHDFGVTLGLVSRDKRMNAAELRPGDRQHLTRRVELHRAGPERDHGRIEPDVLPFEASDVPHHLGFRPVGSEHRVRHECARATYGRGVVVSRNRPRMRKVANEACTREDTDDVADVRHRHRLVERYADCFGVDVSEVDACGDRTSTHRFHSRWDLHT